MSIWNCTDDGNEIARLLAKALPNVDTDTQMLALEPEQLRALESYADSFTDCLLAQQEALADLLAHADVPELRKGTLQSVGFLLGTLSEVHEIVRRIVSMAGAYANPETRALYRAMERKDGAEVARLMQ